MARKKLSEEMRQACLKMAAEHPEMSTREIAKAMPPYEIISKDGVKKQNVSYGWVASVLKTNKPIEPQAEVQNAL